MTEKSIILILNGLNRNPNYRNCIKLSISKDVELAHIWIENSRNKNSPKTFFLIKESNEYVGAVLDMITDLHWVVLPKHRKKGHLTKALKETILPYIFIHFERENQTISIKLSEIGQKNYLNSMTTALKVGFNKVDGDNFILDEDDFDFSNEKLDIKYNGLEDNEIDGISKELKAIARKVSVINSKIELSLGQFPANYMKPSLDVISDKLSYFTTLIDDINHDHIQNS
jgi:hypothetical protein